MLQTGRDARIERSTDATAHTSDYLVRGLCAVFRLLKAAKSTLISRGAMLALLSLLVPFSVLLAAFNTSHVSAATSNQLNFQGRLLTASGALVPDGTYNVQFNLYYVSTGGSSQWTETRTNQGGTPVTIQNGYYSVYLGEVTAFPGSIDWSEDLYLGMTVRGTGSCAFGSCTPADSEMTPRFKLTAVPYALRASNVASSNTNAASSNTDNISITTGDALGAASDSGNISLDVGTATGTRGSISLGGTNASAITLGSGSGTFVLQTSNIDISSAGVISGATGISSSGTITFSGLNCTGNTNGGALTANGSGVISCSDDDAGGGGGGSLFTDSGTFTYLTSTTDDLVVGDSTVAGASLFVDESAGSTTFGNSTLAGSLIIADGSTNFGTIVSAALSTDRTYTLPDATGTFCLTSGNCLGTGGVGDILNNGQNGQYGLVVMMGIQLFLRVMALTDSRLQAQGQPLSAML